MKKLSHGEGKVKDDKICTGPNETREGGGDGETSEWGTMTEAIKYKSRTVQMGRQAKVNELLDKTVKGVGKTKVKDAGGIHQIQQIKRPVIRGKQEVGPFKDGKGLPRQWYTREGLRKQ